jgi:hypothetical protein
VETESEEQEFLEASEGTRELIPIFVLSPSGTEESRASFSITWKHSPYPCNL